MISVTWFTVLVVVSVVITTGIPLLFLYLFWRDRREGKIW
jgi:hypothetical protein